MLLPFLRHQVARAEAGLITNGLTNCHVLGMDSIVLQDGPTHRLRMFIASHDHELWKNEAHHYQGVPSFPHPLSLGFHGHHCDITLQWVMGRVFNVTARPDLDMDGPFKRYRFDSKIKGGTGSLTELYPRGIAMRSVTMSPMMATQPDEVKLVAQSLHTVYVPRNERAAWLVFESAEDPDYEALVYTNNPAFYPEHLYEPMSQSDIVSNLNWVLRVCDLDLMP